MAAAVAAAALLYVPALVLLFWDRGPDRGTGAAVVAALLLLALVGTAGFVALRPSAPLRTALATLVAGALNCAALVGVFILVLVGGSCDDNGHVGPLAWAGAIAVYLGGAVWGLRRPGRAVWAVPLSTLAGGVWLVGVATLLTGSTGACLD